MKLAFWKKEEKVKLNNIEKPIQGPLNVQAIKHHETRIENLMQEYITKSLTLKDLQQDDKEAKSIRNKKIDSVIFRMAIIKYEVDIRKDHLKWLCS